MFLHIRSPQREVAAKGRPQRLPVRRCAPTCREIWGRRNIRQSSTDWEIMKRPSLAMQSTLQVPKFQFFQMPIFSLSNFPFSKFQSFIFSNIHNFKIPKVQKYQIRKVRYTDLPTFSEFQILSYENIILQGCSHNFLVFFEYFGDKYGVRGDLPQAGFPNKLHHEKALDLEINTGTIIFHENESYATIYAFGKKSTTKMAF